MIFGKVGKTLVGLSLVGVAAAVVWPNLADYVYPQASRQALALRSYLPNAVTTALPAYSDGTAAIASSGPGGSGARTPGAGRPGAGKPGASASRGNGRGGRRRGPGRPVPVIVGKATIGEVPFLIESLGTARAFATVNVKSRVDSVIQKILVRDGAKVKSGDVLVQLDSRQLRAQIRQAEAALDKDTAENNQAKREVQRFSELFSRRSGTQINVENARLKLATTAAAMESDKAQIENLKVQLSYYTIRAPITGRIGIFNAKEGNTIRAGDNNATGILVTIIQASPIYVSFSVPQSFLGQVREAIVSGKGEVEARPQGSNSAIKGRLSLLDNAVDTATGTVTVHALFDNRDEKLWPGQLCDLRIILRRDKNVVSIPREAVQSGQNGNFVFVIENDVAKIAPIKISRPQEGMELIESGLKGDETIVIDGALSLRNGSKVQIRNAQPKRDS